MKFKLIFLLSFVLVLLFTGCAKEEPITVVDGYWKYTLQEDGTYSVGAADQNNMPSRIEIPTEFEGVAVTAITDMGFARCKGLAEVVIPNTFKTLSYGAFYMCPDLQYIYIPNSVKSIDGGVIGMCGSGSWISVDYDGTSGEWDTIFMAGNWAAGTKCQVTCTDRTISYDGT